MGPETTLRLGAAAAVSLLLAALGVRGCSSPAPPRPDTVPVEEATGIPEPLQLLTTAGSPRWSELDPHVREDQRAAWVDSCAALMRLEDCPALLEWLKRPEGQRLERLLGALQGGSREEALAALALVFRLAGATEWEPGVFGGATHADRLGRMLQDWLELWGESGATDPVLYEPTLAAVLQYGRVMRLAYKAGMFGDSDRSLERAREFLGKAAAPTTELGAALADRYPGALPKELKGDTFLRGLADEAKLRFPELDGECGD